MNGTVFLIHWNAEEAEAHAETIRGYGWDVIGVETGDGARAAKAVREARPGVLVITLTRLPSHGRRTAEHLRTLKATRTLPIVFVGGEGTALAKTKEKVPDAIYTTPGELAEALQRINDTGQAT